MEANSAPRWSTYDEYLRIEARLVRLCKTVTPARWDHADRHDAKSLEEEEAPLFADELAWLYNDIGLALCAQGSELEARAVWEQGFEINRVIDPDENSQYIVQSKLHMGHVFLELGRLETAERFLLDTQESNHRLAAEGRIEPAGKNPTMPFESRPAVADYTGRICGYRGLLAHLHGDFEEAERQYSKGLDDLELAGGNPRATSTFLCHLADLYIETRRFEEAERRIRTSRSLAEAAGHPDLVAYARNAEGHLLRAREKRVRARHAYDLALNAARRMGCKRLETEVLSELARLALDTGDAENARRLAFDALRLANALGLGLKQTLGLTVTGLATVRAGNPDLGIAFLRHAHRLAEYQRYRLRSREIEGHLRDLGAEIPSEP